MEHGQEPTVVEVKALIGKDVWMLDILHVRRRRIHVVGITYLYDTEPALRFTNLSGTVSDYIELHAIESLEEA